MSMDPNMIAQMLMQQGGQGGGVAPGGVQTNSQLGSGAAMLQKIMMIQALKNQQPGQQQPGQPPQPNVMGQVAAQPQAMQAQQLPGGTNA